MMKYLLITTICLISLSSGAQVYLSKIYNDVLILGPNNVAPHCDEIAKSYAADIEDLYDVLLKEQDKLQYAVAEIQELSKPTKAQLFTLSEQQGDIDLIEQELTTLMQFKELWLKIVDQTHVKLELVDVIRNGQCVKISTNHGSFVTTEFMATIDKDIKKIKIVEHFSVEQRDSIPTWITKVSDNCTSPDPNDCMKWCYVNQEGGDVLIDFTEDLYRLKDSKIASQFNISPDSKYASRELTMNLEGTTIDIINIVKSDSNLLLQLEGFSTVECQE